MLSDDIMDGTKKTVATVVNAVKSAVKGALLFGALAFAGYAAFSVGAALIAGESLFTGTFLAETVMGFGAKAGAYGASMGAAKVGIMGAAVGAALMGITGFLPGGGEGLSFSRLFKKKEKVEKAQSPAVEQFQQTQPQMPVYMPPAPAPAPATNVVVDNSQRTQILQHSVASTSPQPERQEAPAAALQQATEPATAPQQTPALETAKPAMPETAPLLQGQYPTIEDPAYYRAGKGAELKARGDAAGQGAALAK